MYPVLFRRQLVLTLVLCTIYFGALAQLSANFTIDKPNGCSPLTVQFTNTTTGASAAATYTWDFGNGNTSGLVNPGSIYVLAQAYTVTLTVTDGANTSTKTQQVTVYKNPVVSFSASPLGGCLPLNVSFTANATPGDGTISRYFWDFGDGMTETDSLSNLTAHTYAFAQNAGISLTVTNSYGCYSTISQSGVITVTQAVVASFAADQTTLCQTNNVVNFTNYTAGAGTLTYLWNFGDGTTSANTSPAHTYTTKSTYTVTLTATSSAGCTGDTIKANYINVADFDVGFTLPTPVCMGAENDINDTSTMGYGTTLWNLDGQQIYPNTSNTGAYAFYFNDTLPHVIKLTHAYGNCTVSKSATVSAKASPQLSGFVADITGNCTAPTIVNLSDTTKGAVTWQWFGNYPVLQNPFATTQATSYTFPSLAEYQIGLQVTNGTGCSATVWQTINLQIPVVAINVQNLAGLVSSSGCVGVTLRFSANPDSVIKSYQWNFGDGGTSTLARPNHQFNTAGNFTITLIYATTGGCTDTATYNYINVIGNPSFNFNAQPDTVVCGNTPVTFTVTPQVPPGWSYQWNFGDSSSGAYGSNTATHQYNNDSVYTVTLVAASYGCTDTIVKIDYITVKPDFPRISYQANSCDGTRGTVTFAQASTKVNTWIWDFGDGSNTVTYNSPVDTIYHTYTKTGIYNVGLTGINGACSVVNALTTYVLLKQAPQFSATQSSPCGSSITSIAVNNLETNPAPGNVVNYYGTISELQYGDLTTAPNPVYAQQYGTSIFNGSVTGLNPNENQLRAIMQSYYFNCYDTSNFVPISIHGPVAGYSFIKNNVCLNSPVVLKDSSTADKDAPIAMWQWNLGDGTTLTENTGTNISYIYANPGQYEVILTVTDTAGCTSTTPYNYLVNATVNGPQASFSVSQNTVAPNTTVYFYNNTNLNNAYNVTYTWVFPDGSQSQAYDTSYLFTVVGTDTVKLISFNNQLTCVDTAQQVIYVRTVNTAFMYTYSYINNKNCPPVIVTFTSTTTNAFSISWNFGDGSQGGNQGVVSHTYNNAGVYRVVLYGLDSSNNLDSTVDFITVKGPYAVMAANKLYGCDSLTVEFSASIRNASSFTWDFGDGTLQSNSDTFATHTYLIPAIYNPLLILKDSSGCAGTSTLPNKIVIDTLSVAVTNMPALICDSSVVYFTPAITSVAVSQLQQPLLYHWDFGTGNVQDTGNLSTASFLYRTGGYGVTLMVSSPYGCVQTATDSINVQPASKVGITGPQDICVNSPAVFMGTASNFANNLAWYWTFGDTIADAQVQYPSAVYYKDSGTYTISLWVNNIGCYDTAYSTLYVHGKPVPGILPRKPEVCMGDSVQIIAHHAQTYFWWPAVYISNVNSAAPAVSPVVSSWYYVLATNIYGCTASDSVWVKVNQPFKLTTDSVLNICLGSNGQLSVTGADFYKWISGSGLSNTQVANPVVATNMSQVYTVVGYDSSGCFSDTANIQLYVSAWPTVTVSPHATTINAGGEVQLYTTASADVTAYAWQPTDYLSCSTCPSPISMPRQPIVYTVTVTSGLGCTASDTAKIDLLCSQDLVYIPNAFTPNNDNINDRFVIKGFAVRLIKHIAIYGRLGEKVFEKSNIGGDDYADSWDGNYNNRQVPPGVYVYFAEIICGTGESYNYKGTITLIR